MSAFVQYLSQIIWQWYDELIAAANPIVKKYICVAVTATIGSDDFWRSKICEKDDIAKAAQR